jgi:Tn3 transposase DDE domain/Resolvase, N terminal domain
LDITDRPTGAITLSKYDAAPEPRNLRRIKAEVQRRWGTVALIDILKETVLRTGCLIEVSAVAGSGTLPVEVLAERLMLAIYAYGTNTGIRAVAAGGGHGHTEDEVRYVRRRYLTRDTAQAVAVGIANATFAARQQTLWGEGSTAVASDSIHFRSYDQNIFTEWHSRYGGRGILIYWHVERGSMVVHSQTLRASASEVHAMVEGAIRHGTTMKVEGNFEGIEFDRIFTDKVSGKDLHRPELLAMISFVRDGDTVLVHSMDRLARNLDDLRSTVRTLTGKGVRVEFVKEQLTFTGDDSAMATLLLSVMGAFAEFECALIRDRQREGIALAKQRGAYRG